jgi:hypothetical protein
LSNITHDNRTSTGPAVSGSFSTDINMKGETMNRNVYYSNKVWARKAMTILMNKTVMFETVERRENEQRPFGEYELGLKFHARGHGWVTIWPVDQSDLGEVSALAE